MNGAKRKLQGVKRAVLAVALLTAPPAPSESAPRAPSVRPCAPLRVKAGTLEQSLKQLGVERGFEVAFGNPKVAGLEVKAGLLDGSNCVIAITRFLEERNLSFALSEGPGKSIRRLMVVDFKSKLLAGSRTSPGGRAGFVPAEPPPEVVDPAPPTEAAVKDKLPDPDELIDLGNGIKMFKIPPPYVPMTPGLVPPNAVVAGPEVLAESFHGAENAQVNAVITPTASTPTPTATPKPTTTSSPLPPNARPPAPTPTPQG